MAFGEKLLALALVGMTLVGGAVGGLFNDDEEEEQDIDAPDSRVMPTSGLFYLKMPVEPRDIFDHDGMDLGGSANVDDTLANVRPDGLGNDGVVVHWAGSDGRDGSGISFFDVQVKEGPDGEWEFWRIGTKETSSMFYPKDEGQYLFRCRATDKAGNIEEWPVIADSGFTVKVLGFDDPGHGLPGPMDGPGLPFDD